MLIRKFLENYGSTTISFKQMSDKYHLTILADGFIKDIFHRIVAIYVDDIGVMIGFSLTNKTCQTFLDILQNAKHVPIGVQLFDHKNKITRASLVIDKIDVSLIDNQIISDYMRNNQITGEIYVRRSTFIKYNEKMELLEYVLPSLEQLLNKYKDKEIK